MNLGFPLLKRIVRTFPSKQRFRNQAALFATQTNKTLVPFKLTDIGEGIAEVELLKWFVKVFWKSNSFCPTFTRCMWTFAVFLSCLTKVSTAVRRVTSSNRLIESAKCKAIKLQLRSQADMLGLWELFITRRALLLRWNTITCSAKLHLWNERDILLNPICLITRAC